MTAEPETNHRRRALALLAVAVLLLAATVGVVVSDVGQPTRQYHRVDVAASDGTLALSGPDEALPSEGIDLIDCDGVDTGRACLLERALLRAPNASLLLPHTAHDGAPFVQVDGALYRRTHTEYNRSHARYSLQRVSPTTVADEISMNASALSAAGRRILDRGSARIPAGERVLTGTLIDTGDGYALLTRASGSRRGGLPPVEIPLAALGLLAFARAGQQFTRAPPRH